MNPPIVNLRRQQYFFNFLKDRFRANFFSSYSLEIGKMQTEGKININNKKTSHKDKIKIV